MLRLSGALRRRVQWVVHPAGAQVRLQPPLGAYGEAGTAGAAWAIASAGGNVLLTGPAGTGKLTALRDIAGRLEAAGKRVALTSTRPAGATAVGGMLFLSFAGLRPNVEVVGTEQAVTSMKRHMRMVRDSYCGMADSFATVDVVVLEGLEGLSVPTFEAMDQAAREARECPDKPFGGLQIVAAANFWRQPGVHPTSPLHGYIHQHPLWRVAFPQGHELVTHTFWRHRAAAKTEEEAALLSQMTLKALFGHFTPDDADALEALTPPPTTAQSTIVHFAGVRRGRKEKSPTPSADVNPMHALAGVDAPTGPDVERDEPAQVYLDSDRTFLVDHQIAFRRWAPKFPRQPHLWSPCPRSAAVRKTHYGYYLTNTVPHVSLSPQFGMSTLLDLSVGQRCVPTTDIFADAELTDLKLPVGTPCIIKEVEEHKLVVIVTGVPPGPTRRGAPKEGKLVDVHKVRVITTMECMPAIEYATTQFPLLPADVISPQILLGENYVPRRLMLDGRLLSSTNDLGNILAHTTSLDALSFRPGSLRTYLDREGMVHEPTRVYYQGLLSDEQLRDAGADPAAARWCRNCKSHVPASKFTEHWRRCVERVRWCVDCGATVPVQKWDAHVEKHAVVMCIDCGKSMEWSDWEKHRLLCQSMMRELTAENPLLPSATRDSALSAGFDRTDLHTIKQLSKVHLPKSHLQVRNRNKVRI